MSNDAAAPDRSHASDDHASESPRPSEQSKPDRDAQHDRPSDDVSTPSAEELHGPNAEHD